MEGFTLKKKICLVAGYAPSVINFRKELILELTQNHEVTVCAPAITIDLKAKIESLGARCLNVEISEGKTNPFNDINYLMQLFKHFKKMKPDVVLSYTIKPVIWGSIAAKLAGVPFISSMITGLGYSFSEMDSYKRKFVNKMVCFLYKRSLHFNQMVLFQNIDDQNLFKEKGFLSNTPSVLINGSGVNLNHYYYSDQFPKRITFLMVSRLLKDKGVYQYIEAAKQIKAEHENVDFNLAGWIDNNPSCIKEDELASWQADGTINFLGKLDDVRDSIAAASVFVLPSFYREGTPRSVLEAMSMGRPIITTDAPGCRETVTHAVNGYLIPIKDVANLVSSMKKFIHDSALIHQFGEQSRAIAINKYDVHKVNRTIIDALQLQPTTMPS